jgi:hypothetical protein
VSQWGGKFFYGWVDAFGEENADKCAYRYGSTLVLTDADYWNVMLAGKKFLVQMNWINGNALEQGCRVAL